MRSGLAHAVHHTRYRSVFQKHLVDQPLIPAACLPTWRCMSRPRPLPVMQLCRSFDLTPSAIPRKQRGCGCRRRSIKYWVCKSAPGFLYEALECLGGNGYVEDGILARHYREAPVNAVWEASGNVMCLDVLRAFSRDPDAAAALLSRAGGSGRKGYPVSARRSPSSARRSAVPTASGWRGLRSNGWRCSPPPRRSTRYRRGTPNCSPRPGLPRPMPACMARWIWPMATFVLCWNGHCRDTPSWGMHNRKPLIGLAQS